MTKFRVVLLILVIALSQQPVTMQGSSTNISSMIKYQPYQYTRPVLTNVNGSTVIPIAKNNGVLLQPFYWDMPDRGTHWRMLADNMNMFVKDGFDSMWLPPPSKTREGYPATGGYEPYDYYDLGSYNQRGRVRTLFGTQQELVDLIKLANQNNIGVIADVVINHRVGGKDEFNPYTGTTTPTNFMDVASGKLKMNYTDFWPNAYGSGDTGVYGNFPDISFANPEVRTMFLEWAKWLRDTIGYDGFRFDSAQFFDPTMVRDWMQYLRKDTPDVFGVSEYWMHDPVVDTVRSYLAATNNTVRNMDFALLDTLRLAMNRNGTFDMRDLVGKGIIGADPEQSVTFAVNHDTYRDKFNIIESRRHLAYAYIMTHPGYPSVFWMDYLNLNLRNHIRTLVKIHNEFARGNFTMLYSDQDLYVAQRGGDATSPGLILVLSDNPTKRLSVDVTSQYKNSVLNNLVNSSESYSSDSMGKVRLSVPADGYAIYSTADPVADLDMRIPAEKTVYPTTLQQQSITIDGELDPQWGVPVAIDGKGDLSPADLNNLYLSQDANNLYVAFGYDVFNNWTKGPIQYGIALDVKSGGGNDDPVNAEIKYGGGKLPNYMYYLTTDFNQENHYARDITSIDGYHYQNGWQSYASDSIVAASHPMLGLIEVAIPLNQIELQAGGQISVKIVSSLASDGKAIDSIPSDTNIVADGTSWLFLPNTIAVTGSQSTTTKTFFIVPVTVIVLVIIQRKQKRIVASR